MTPPTQRRSPTRPDADALAALSAPSRPALAKAPASDPVLAARGTAPTPAAEPPAPAAKAAPRRKTAAQPTAEKTKVGIYQDPDEAARARAAYTWTRANEGHRSFSDFISHAIMREVQRLEDEYNGGKSWVAIGPGELPTGRPLRD